MTGLKPALKWRPRAEEDLLKYAAYIKADSQQAARKWQKSLRAKIEYLPDNPEIYRISSRLKNARELVFAKNYLVIYRYDKRKNQIDILRIIHTKKRTAKDRVPPIS